MVCYLLALAIMTRLLWGLIQAWRSGCCSVVSLYDVELGVIWNARIDGIVGWMNGVLYDRIRVKSRNADGLCPPADAIAQKAVVFITSCCVCSQDPKFKSAPIEEQPRSSASCKAQVMAGAPSSRPSPPTASPSSPMESNLRSFDPPPRFRSRPRQKPNVTGISTSFSLIITIVPR